MEKEFVPYEIALALKELGFDEPCFGFYGTDGYLYLQHARNGNIFKRNNGCLSPTFSQTFRFFREKYDLQYTITWNKHYPKTPYEWEVRKSWRDEPLRPYGIGGMSATYEEAELECLKKLIEIAKE